MKKIDQCAQGNTQRGQTVHKEYSGRPVQLGINKVDIVLLRNKVYYLEPAFVMMNYCVLAFPNTSLLK